MNETVLKDALYNLSDKAGDSHKFARGILVGVTAALVANGKNFHEATDIVKKFMPDNIDRKRIPEGWEERFEGKLKPKGIQMDQRRGWTP
jgi:hypothetical protein